MSNHTRNNLNSKNVSTILLNHALNMCVWNKMFLPKVFKHNNGQYHNIFHIFNHGSKVLANFALHYTVQSLITNSTGPLT